MFLGLGHSDVVAFLDNRRMLEKNEGIGAIEKKVLLTISSSLVRTTVRDV